MYRYDISLLNQCCVRSSTQV